VKGSAGVCGRLYWEEDLCESCLAKGEMGEISASFIRTHEDRSFTSGVVLITALLSKGLYGFRNM
jgi:hypothetical protein